MTLFSYRRGLKELFETIKELNKNNEYWFRGHSKEDDIFTAQCIYKIKEN